jgi:hypothetical protein
VRKTPVFIWLLVLPVFGQEFRGTLQGNFTFVLPGSYTLEATASKVAP